MTTLPCVCVQLFVREPEQRLGIKGNVRQHKFFSGIDWCAVELRQVEPPFRPTVVTTPVLSYTQCS